MTKSITQYKNEKRKRRHQRVRSTIFGTGVRPRLSVFRSSKYIYAQLIDDEKMITIAQATDMGKDLKMTKQEKAVQVGMEIAKKAKDLGIEKIVFDRGGFLFKGRVMALSRGAREGGLNF